MQMSRDASFNPEWGYIAPAPGFIRTARLVIVAAAIGATAGAAVVFSLVDRPGAEESVAARTMVRQPIASASPAVNAPVAAQLQTESRHAPQLAQSRADAPNAVQRQSATPSPASAGPVGSTLSEIGVASTAQRPASAAALAEAPAATAAPPAQGANETVAAAPEAAPAPAPKAPIKKPRLTWRAAPRYDTSRYDQRYVQMERGPFGWQRQFGAPEY
jgi:hypothetical protein